jgi:hypothetical protein
MTSLMSVFLTFIEHLPLGKAFSFGSSDILFGTQKKLELVCNEAINEICPRL